VKTLAFIVLRAGRPCFLFNAAATMRGGVLIPGSPVKVFTKRRDARRAINRTKRVATLLNGSLIADHKPVAELLEVLASPETFSIEPLTK
jgi:hypothetical protein